MAARSFLKKLYASAHNMRKFCKPRYPALRLRAPPKTLEQVALAGWWGKLSHNLINRPSYLIVILGSRTCSIVR